LVGEEGEVCIEPPVRVVRELQFHAILELDLEAIFIHPEAGHAGARLLRVEVVEIVEAEAGDLLAVFLAGVHEIEAKSHSAGGTEVEVPAGKQPRVLVLAGDGVSLATEHDAVGVEQERPPV